MKPRALLQAFDGLISPTALLAVEYAKVSNIYDSTQNVLTGRRTCGRIGRPGLRHTTTLAPAKSCERLMEAAVEGAPFDAGRG